MSVVWFEIGSLFCGVATSVNFLIFGRAVAGLGGAGSEYHPISTPPLDFVLMWSPSFRFRAIHHRRHHTSRRQAQAIRVSESKVHLNVKCSCKL